ncbi:MAG: NAD(P)-dependent oxidoreductase [Lachnospiraceae bacterium]|nr:NAD(P)-dependent oxidoreductase [Lachnospiraceae bacterium]
MKTVVVTGATGFIGARLVKELVSNGIDVIALVRDIDKARIQLGSDITLIKYYSDEYHELSKKSPDIDVFYHLAWSGVAPERKNDRVVQVKNIDLAMEMLEYANALGVKRFIATGTVAEYTFCEDIMDVNAKQTPNDLYGAAKTASHYMLETWARNIGMPFNWVVIPSTYGEGRKDNNILTYTIRTLLNSEKPSYGYLTQMWDFLYVGEVARALYLIGQKGSAGKTYAIGSGDYRPLKEYVEIIRDSIDPQLELGIGEIPSMSEKVFSSCVSIRELQKDTGFVPEVTFEEGIKKTIDHYRGIRHDAE